MTSMEKLQPFFDAYSQKIRQRRNDLGMTATIGKGGRSNEVKEAIVRNGGLYLLAIGGAGAVAASHITSMEEIAFAELGCESVKKLVFDDFPLIVGTDAYGNDIFERNR